jgi:SHS2 domain-containing protein
MARLDYRVLDHPSDLLIEVRAEGAEDLFAGAAVALCREIAGSDVPDPTESRVLAAEGHDAEDLLVRWLARVIALVYEEGCYVSGFAGIELAPGKARGTAYVVPWQGTGRAPLLECKAVTYHALVLRLAPGDCVARFLVDL